MNQTRGFRAARRQRGATLIGLLIGVMISLITIAGLLVLYQVMIELSLDATRSSQRDGQAAATLLAAQIELQAAGFGVPAGDPLNTRVALRANGKELVWRHKLAVTDAGFLCSGLRIVDGQGFHRLPAKDCVDASVANWMPNERVAMAGSAAFFASAGDDPAAGADASAKQGGVTLAGDFRFRLAAPAACLPYMQHDPAAAPAPSPRVELASADGARVLFTACLPNLATVVAP